MTKVTDAMDLRNAMQMADFQKMEKVRARADKVVADKDTAESLKPYYNQFCKRPCFVDTYKHLIILTLNWWIQMGKG